MFCMVCHALVLYAYHMMWIIRQQDKDSELPYKHCLNCGAELNGRFCHKCGQQAVSKTPTVFGFIIEYINNAFIWDPRFIQTIWTLVRRPGHLTNEYLSGKFVSQEHPLKLNMFLLFVFVTLFLIFSGTDKMNSSVHNLTTDERIFSGIQMELLMDKEEYKEKFIECERDTVLLSAPLFLEEKYPEIISHLETIKDTEGEGLDLWRAIVPKTLIEESIIVQDTNGLYSFNTEIHLVNETIEIINKIWSEMVNLLAKYLPLIVLFTAPMLTLSLRFVQRKNRQPRINHFIFALHYTAFLELLMLFIYILHLVVSIPSELMQCIVAICPCIYLTIAFYRVYNTGTWLSAAFKAVITSIIYFLICLMMFVVVFMIALIIVICTL